MSVLLTLVKKLVSDQLKFYDYYLVVLKSKGFKELMIGGASRRLLILALFEIRIT